FARGREPRGDVHALQPLRQLRWQQGRLHALRKAKLLLETIFVGADRFVQPRVLDRDRGLAGQELKDLDVGLRERVELWALQIEDADAPIFEQQRDDQLRAGVVHELDVARIGRDVGHEHGFFVQRGVAGETGPELHARYGDLVAVANRHLHLQLAGVLVQEEDAERAVVDDAAR